MAERRVPLDFVVSAKGVQQTAGAFDRLESSLKSLRKSAPSQAFEEIGKMLRGAGVAGAGFFLLNEFADGANKAGEAMEKLRRGTISQAEANRELLKSLPVVGRLFESIDSVSKGIIALQWGNLVDPAGAQRFKQYNEQQKEIAKGFKEIAREAERATRAMGLTGTAKMREEAATEEDALHRQRTELINKRFPLNAVNTEEVDRELDRAIRAVEERLAAVARKNVGEIAAKEYWDEWEKRRADIFGRKGQGELLKTFGKMLTSGAPGDLLGMAGGAAGDWLSGLAPYMTWQRGGGAQFSGGLAPSDQSRFLTGVGAAGRENQPISQTAKNTAQTNKILGDMLHFWRQTWAKFGGFGNLPIFNG